MPRLTEAALRKPPEETPRATQRRLRLQARNGTRDGWAFFFRQAVELVDVHWREQWSGKAQDSKEERAS